MNYSSGIDFHTPPLIKKPTVYFHVECRLLLVVIASVRLPSSQVTDSASASPGRIGTVPRPGSWWDDERIPSLIRLSRLALGLLRYWPAAHQPHFTGRIHLLADDIADVAHHVLFFFSLSARTLL